jgi:hypothetical protein
MRRHVPHRLCVDLSFFTGLVLALFSVKYEILSWLHGTRQKLFFRTELVLRVTFV